MGWIFGGLGCLQALSNPFKFFFKKATEKLVIDLFISSRQLSLTFLKHRVVVIGLFISSWQLSLTFLYCYTRTFFSSYPSLLES